MDSAEQQYQRDIARIEAHKLNLKDDEFRRLIGHVLKAVREHERDRRDRGAQIKLNDHDPTNVTVANLDGLRVVTFASNAVRHTVDIQGVGIHYAFEVVIDHYQKPVVTGRKYGQAMGVMTDDAITDACRSAIDSVTDLPQPIDPCRWAAPTLRSAKNPAPGRSRKRRRNDMRELSPEEKAARDAAIKEGERLRKERMQPSWLKKWMRQIPVKVGRPGKPQ